MVINAPTGELWQQVTMRAAITLAFMIGSTLPAFADGDVGVVVAGEGAMLPQTLAQLESWLSERGYVVVASPLPPDAISDLMNCFVLGHPGCARDVVDRRARASAVVYVEVETRRGTRDMALTVSWIDKVHAARVQRGTCEHCTNASLSAVANDVMTQLTRAVASAGGLVPPRGPRPAARLADVEAPVRRGRSRVVPLTVMAAGAVAVIAGGVLIALDREPGPYAPPAIHTSAPAGAGISIAGTVVAGIGAYLWFRPPGVRSSPVASVTADTAYLGWRGWF
jgi:hypothetical protein